MSAAAEARSKGLIGPNAITRVAEAATAVAGPGASRDIFERAGLIDHWDHPPDTMVPDAEVARLHLALRETFGPRTAGRIGAEAGRLTAEYLLARRIPRVAQAILRMLPQRMAIRLFLKAITHHAWTFAGAGRFRWEETRAGFVLRLAGGPVGRLVTSETPACAYYAATFETLFRRVGGKTIGVIELECEASGAPECVFAVTFG